MPLATASVTSQHYNFSTNQDCHPMYVVPMAGCPNGIIFLVYYPAGTGHYDAAIPRSYTVTKPKFTNTDSKPLHIKTRCIVTDLELI